MVPPEYSVYFMTMATVGATLFGLIFLAVSISPERYSDGQPIVRQAIAISAYVALLNPLIISMFALVPGQAIGVVVTSVGAFGFLNTLGVFVAVFATYRSGRAIFRNSSFVIISIIFYSLQILDGIGLAQQPGNAGNFNLLVNMMIAITLLGIGRAWGLFGIQLFTFRRWISALKEPPKQANADKNLDKSEAAVKRDERAR